MKKFLFAFFLTASLSILIPVVSHATQYYNAQGVPTTVPVWGGVFYTANGTAVNVSGAGGNTTGYYDAQGNPVTVPASGGVFYTADHTPVRISAAGGNPTPAADNSSGATQYYDAQGVPSAVPIWGGDFYRADGTAVHISASGGNTAGYYDANGNPVTLFGPGSTANPQTLYDAHHNPVNISAAGGGSGTAAPVTPAPQTAPVNITSQGPKDNGLVQCGKSNAVGSVKTPYLAQGCGFADLIAMINAIIKYLIMIAMPLAAVAFAYAGWLRLSAGDNPGQITKSNHVFATVGIGLIVILSGWLVFTLIAKTFLDPAAGYGTYLN